MLRSKYSAMVEAPRSPRCFPACPVRKTSDPWKVTWRVPLWFPQALRPWWQRLRFALLGDLGEKAVLGRDGWLFYAPDVRYLVEPFPTATSDAKNDDPLSAIIAFRDQLARKGIRLLVVPMPVKPSVYPDKLTRRVLAGGQSFSSHTLELISKLRAAGVEVANLFETFRELREKNSLSESEPYYLVRDTHWSGKAVIIAAEEVAEQIRRLGWIDSGSTDYDLKAVVAKRRSDVAQMVKAPGVEEKYPPEDVLCHQVVQKNDGKPYQDDPHSPVLVLGDSFLRIYQRDEPTAAGFISHLAMKLRRPLASIVNDGGASTLVRQELARRRGTSPRQTARDLGICGTRHPIRHGGLETGCSAVSCGTTMPTSPLSGEL